MGTHLSRCVCGHADIYPATVLGAPQSPINRIPPEILAAILKFAIEADLDRPFGMWPGLFDSTFSQWNAAYIPRCSCSAEGLERFMLVCRRWYAVIREFPELWNIIMINQPGRRTKDQVAECLSRSGQTHLKLFATISSPSLTGDVAAVAANSSRLEKLYLGSQHPDCLREVLSQFMFPAPSLRCLVLALESTTPVSVPVLFEDCTPRLSHLSLTGPVIFAGNSFRGLTHLIIHNHPQPVTGDVSAPFSDFIALLRGNPDLEQLSIWNTYSYFGTLGDQIVVSPEMDRVVFTRLRRLSVSLCEPHHIRTLLALFQLPAETTICILGRQSPLHSRSLFDSIPEDTSCLANFRNITKLELVLDATRSHAIGIGQESAFMIDMDPFAERHSGRYHAATLLDLARTHLDTSAITELWLLRNGEDDPLPHGEIVVATALSSMNSLSKLVLSLTWPYTATVLSVLSAHDDLNGRPLCPGLQDLTVYYAARRRDAPIPFKFKPLIDFAIQRAVKGVPCRNLMIHNDGRYPFELIHQLHPYVMDVRVGRAQRAPAARMPIPSEYADEEHSIYWRDWRWRD